MINNQLWLQVRAYLFKQGNGKTNSDSKYSRVVHEGFTTRKIELTKTFLKPMRDEICQKLADSWHFLGTYHKPKSRELYLDVRFRVDKTDVDTCKTVITKYCESAKKNRLITDFEFDDTFYDRYSQRFTPGQIEIILPTLQLYCDRYLEMISSETDYEKAIRSVSEDLFKIFGEVSHLVLFQTGIDDKIFHLFEAFMWSEDEAILQNLTQYLAERNPGFKKHLLEFRDQIEIPRLQDLFKRYSQKF